MTHDNHNQQLEMSIGNPVLADCTICQTEEGRKEFGQSSPKALPLDCYEITTIYRDSGETFQPQYAVCSDCLLHAVNLGVHVKKNGEYWNGSNSMFIRNTDAEAINKVFENATKRREEAK